MLKRFLALALCATTVFSSCEDGLEDANLLFNDLPNTFFNTKCGTYRIGKDVEATERCGNSWDSFGYQYQDDVDVAQIILTPSDDSISDYNPTVRIWFDSNYLKAGETLDKSQVIAKCSRFRAENGSGDPTYYTVAPSNFRLTVEENKGEKTHRIIGDEAQWVFSWDIACPGLEMTAEGKDQINLDYRTARHAKIHLTESPPKKEN